MKFGLMKPILTFCTMAVTMPLLANSGNLVLTDEHSHFSSGSNFGCGTLLVSGIGSEEEISSEERSEDPNSIIIHKDQSFGEVWELLGYTMSEGEGTAHLPDYQLRVIEQNGPMLKVVFKKLRATPRSFEDGLSQSEKDDIGYIVKTLSNYSLAKIKGEESSLKRAGDRIDHVHPLHFLLCVFLDEELKVCLRNLEGRSWVWKDFLKGLTESLEQEYGRGNLMPYLDDFASQLNIDADVLMPVIKKGRWEKFVTLLISIIPRAPGSDRYDM